MLDSETNNNAELTAVEDEDGEILLWPDLRRVPLYYEKVTDLETCMDDSTSLVDIMASLGKSHAKRQSPGRASGHKSDFV